MPVVVVQSVKDFNRVGNDVLVMCRGKKSTCSETFRSAVDFYGE